VNNPVISLPTAARISWGAGSRAFELRSVDTEVLERASVVFRPWAIHGSGTPIAWEVTRSSEGFVLTRAAPGTSVPQRLMSRRGAAHVVSVVESSAVLALADEPDVLSFHAALVGRGDRGVLILGPNEAGKSTLACALWQRGFTFLGDDVAVLNEDNRAAGSAPRRVSLRDQSRTLLGEQVWADVLAAPSAERTADGYLFHPDEVDGRLRPASVRVMVCVFLARRSIVTAAGEMRRVPPNETVLSLLPYSSLAGRGDVGQAIARIATLSTHVAMYDLGRGPLDDMAAAVERMVEEG
jgi:hypothetical protein